MVIIDKVILLAIFACAGLTLAARKNVTDILADLLAVRGDPTALDAAIEGFEGITEQKLSAAVTCQLCDAAADGMISVRRAGASNDQIGGILVKFCSLLFKYGEEACKGTVNIMLDSILYMIDNRKDMTGQRMCSIVLQKQKCEDVNAEKWEIPLPPPQKNNDLKALEGTADSSTVNILHLTDFHYDPLYQNGSNAVCDEPLCCQTGTPSKSEDAAGLWGDYHVCDNPKRTIDNVLQDIGKYHLDNIDVVYFTGDIISHRFWDTTRESNTEAIGELLGLFDDAFRGKDIYPILGNHEPHPADFYAPDSVTDERLSSKWMFEVSATQWSKWLPEETKSTILKGGYYTLMTKYGYRIIALNSNVCFTNNFWLFLEDKDPYGQLSWLVDELYKAEKNNEKVHILSHIPPGDADCHKQWANQFRKIVDRFAGTISAQFNGHSHIDEIRLFRNPENVTQVTNVAFNGGGFTTFVGYNPNYRIYQVQTSTGIVENYDQYIFNLTRANQDSTPDWYRLYNFKDAYGLADLSLRSFEELLDKLSKNDDLMSQYYEFLVKSSDAYPTSGCGKACLKQRLCLITAVDTASALEC